MIKCPNCGSTAQIHLRREVIDHGYLIGIKRYYECGNCNLLIKKTFQKFRWCTPEVKLEEEDE